MRDHARWLPSLSIVLRGWPCELLPRRGGQSGTYGTYSLHAWVVVQHCARAPPNLPAIPSLVSCPYRSTPFPPSSFLLPPQSAAQELSFECAPRLTVYLEFDQLLDALPYLDRVLFVEPLVVWGSREVGAGAWQG